MSPCRPHRSLRRTLATLALTGQFVACTTWRAAPTDVRRAIADEQPAQVRLTLSGGESVVIRTPSIRGDSIIGARGGDTQSVSVSDVRVVETRRIHPGAYLMSAFVVIGTAIGLVIAHEGGRAEPTDGGAGGRN